MRIAVLGLGFMGSTHLKAWTEVPAAALHAVYSSDERKLTGDLTGIQGNLGGPGERFDFSAVRKYTDLASVLRDPDIDAVDICLPTDLHSQVAIDALRAGKHVLVEKPLALDGAAADSVLAEAARTTRTLMAAQVLRFIPAYRLLFERIKSGQTGPIRSAAFQRRCAAPAWSRWLSNPERSGGGVFDLLIHDVDYCIGLLGLPDAVAATGVTDLPAGIDQISATLIYPGSVMNVSGGWFRGAAFPFSMQYTASTDAGTFDYASWRTADPVLFYPADGETVAEPLNAEDGFVAELRYFVEICASGRKPDFCPPAESAAAVKLMRLIEESRTRQGEKLPCRF